MNLNFLKTFQHLSISLSFSKTAEAMKTSQPAISRQIKLLEEHFGQSLFVRNKKSVVLSPFGESISQRINSLITELESVLNLDSAELAISLNGASIQDFGKFYVFPKLLPYLKKHQELNLSLSLGSATKIIEEINLGKLDFGVTHISPTHKTIEVVKLKSEKSVFVGPLKSDLKATLTQKNISLAGYRLDDSYTNVFIDQNFKKALRQKFVQKYAVNSHELMCDLIFSQGCYGILPLSSIQDELKRKRVKILLENKVDEHIYFIYHESLKQNNQKMKMIREIISLLQT